MADYASRPYEIAIDRQQGQLERALAPIASETVTTILGFTEIDDGRLFNSAAAVYKGVVSYGSSGIVDRDGTVLHTAKRPEAGLIVAEIETKHLSVA